MDNNKLVSVIIANYNNHKYLEQCINSVLAQTYDNIEIVVVDDCSTDDSLSLLRQYEEKYSNVKVFVNEQNLGVTKTRMNAISKATGDYITVLDPDDYYVCNDKILNEMNLISKFKTEYNEDIIAFSKYNRVDINGVFQFSFTDRAEIQTGDISDLFFLRKKYIPIFYLMSRQQYDSIGGYDEQIPIYEDHDLSLKLASKYEFYYTGCEGFAVRYTQKGLSSAHISHHNKWLIYIYKSNFHLLKKKRFLVGAKLYLDYVKSKLRFLKRFAEKLLCMK